MTVNSEDNNYVMTFESSHQAMAAEKALLLAGQKLSIIPTPREISSECGFSLLLENTGEQQLYDRMKELKLNWSALYSVGAAKGAKTYEKIY